MLNVDDLCRQLKISRQTLYRMRKRGVLPAPIVVGSQLRWRENDIDAWLDWLATRANERQMGLDPDRQTAEGPPVMSTGDVLFDPRSARAREEEEARQQRNQEIEANHSAAEASPAGNSQ